MRRQALGMVLSVALGLAACARAPVPRTSATEPDTLVPDYDHPMSSWDSLIQPSVLVETAQEAEADLGFDILVPGSELGSPAKILVTDPQVVPAELSEVGFQYKGSQYGMYWILEQESSMTQEELEGLPDQCDQAQGCSAKWSVVTLQLGQRAVLVEGPDVTSIAWLSDGLRITVTGPSDTFTGRSALSVADSM